MVLIRSRGHVHPVGAPMPSDVCRSTKGTIKMIKTTLLSTVFVAAVSAAALAGNAVELTDANTAKIRQILTDEGYEVGKIKLEDGLYEAYARKDGHKYEVFFDGDFAQVRIKEDD
jgi:hypothetical protein